MAEAILVGLQAKGELLVVVFEEVEEAVLPEPKGVVCGRYRKAFIVKP